MSQSRGLLGAVRTGLRPGLSAGERQTQDRPAPVRAERVEVGWRDATLLGGEAEVQVKARVLGLDGAQALAEDHSIRRARRVDVDDVADSAAAGQARDHAHDRRDTAAGADQEQLFGSRIRQHEGSFDAPETDDFAGTRVTHQVGRDPSGLDQLRGDRDAAVARSGSEVRE